MRVLVCGGRDYIDYPLVCQALDYLHGLYGITHVIHGDARGADTLGKNWAILRGVPHTPCPANWNRDGKAAGPIRNQWMLDNQQLQYVVAFPGGKGTAHMVGISTRAGLPVWDLRRVTPCR